MRPDVGSRMRETDEAGALRKEARDRCGQMWGGGCGRQIRSGAGGRMREKMRQVEPDEGWEAFEIVALVAKGFLTNHD